MNQIIIVIITAIVNNLFLNLDDSRFSGARGSVVG
jgi:hypothetical protein